MKRYGNLFGEIASFANLWAAAQRACRGKRFRPDVAAFHFDLERNLLRLEDELVARTYLPGPYRSFAIRDPKPRLISAAPYRDRVVHQVASWLGFLRHGDTLGLQRRLLGRTRFVRRSGGVT